MVLLLGSLLWNYVSFSAFFFLVSMLALGEFYKIAEKLNTRPYKATGFILAILIYVSVLRIDYFVGPETFSYRYFNLLMLCLTFVVAAVAMFSKREQPLHNALFTVFGIVYAVLPFCILHRLVVFSGPVVAGAVYNPWQLFSVIILIWSNDTLAYLGGSLFGRHKMIERISPGKTWEGTLTGIALTTPISYFLKSDFGGDNDSMRWIFYGVLVPILATIGDLVESMIKRQAGVKDSGSIMPGHGGALDRFDSLIFVTPFVLVINSVIS